MREALLMWLATSGPRLCCRLLPGEPLSSTRCSTAVQMQGAPAPSSASTAAVPKLWACTAAAWLGQAHRVRVCPSHSCSACAVLTALQSLLAGPGCAWPVLRRKLGRLCTWHRHKAERSAAGLGSACRTCSAHEQHAALQELELPSTGGWLYHEFARLALGL